MRLDQAVASLLGVSRNRAQFFVKHGLVRVGSTICLTCSRDVGEDSSLIQVESNPQL
jgi:RNA-binding protein YlmH